MARDRTDNRQPLAEIPEVSGRVGPLLSPNGALSTKLVPVVDSIRQLATGFGMRPYRVFIIHHQWSGGRVGAGNPIEISRREILPTPRVGDMGGTNQVLHTYGLQEEGGISVDHISAKYTEDDLMGRTPDTTDPVQTRSGAQDVEFFWEVVENRSANPEPVRRRYVPTVAPTLGGFGWRVSLTKQEFNRNRQGSALPATRPFR